MDSSLEQNQPPVRVLIVDDEQLVRFALRAILTSDPSIEVIGEASDGAAAIEQVRMHRPDVVLMDVSMPGVAGPQATEAIIAQSSAKVLAMTGLRAEEHMLQMLRVGASGYLLKDEPPQRIIEAVRRTAAGEPVLSAVNAAQLVRLVVADEGGTERGAALARIEGLTERERDVALGVAAGATNQEIGARLHIAPGTVKTHLEQVFVKLGVRGRLQVGMLVERAGLGPVDI
ncbi:response regulator [uncultured Microbacterium sp.]|uniref:response regulator n=1 Tax=uncultured Microbacterium sp. TaxID=191216 RepID=UPI0026391877|nr:response regulator transcription factor [uncultured Microbacterium sp.]